MPLRRLRAALPILSCCALAACGGGGGSSTPPAPIPTATPNAVVVTNLNDSGTGSLRAAIAAVNAAPAGTSSTIAFTISGTIVLVTALPPIAANVKIDGTTAPSYAGSAPVLAINANGNAGLVFATSANNAQLVAIAVENANGSGVTLNASSIMVKSDYIGVNLAGAAAPNSGDGVYVTGSNNTIAQSVISANTGNGISLHGAAMNTIAANRVGTNPAGTAALGNGQNGIWVTAASTGNEIGGTVYTNASGQSNDPTGNKGTTTPTFVIPALGNLISANGADGVLIDTLSLNNTLNGNFIGTTATGVAALGNAGDGVAIDGAGLNSLVGCGVTNNPFVYYNVVSGNGGNGLHITSSDNVTVQGNFFGIGADNTTIVANKGDGILVDGSSHNTQVGGVIPLGNVAAGNAKDGIEVTGTVAGFTTFNTFGGLLAFKGAAANGNDGVLITATGGNQTVRTNVLSGNANNGLEIGGNASGVTVDPNIIGLDTTGLALLPNGNDGVSDRRHGKHQHDRRLRGLGDSAKHIFWEQGLRHRDRRSSLCEPSLQYIRRDGGARRFGVAQCARGHLCRRERDEQRDRWCPEYQSANAKSHQWERRVRRNARRGHEFDRRDRQYHRAQSVGGTAPECNRSDLRQSGEHVGYDRREPYKLTVPAGALHERLVEQTQPIGHNIHDLDREEWMDPDQ